jgi:hypothetical protein
MNHGHFSATERQSVRTDNGPQRHQQGTNIFISTGPRSKSMLITFLDEHGVILKVFVPEM